MNLSCISSITRCGKRSFYDTTNEAVALTGNNAYELDGARLVKQAGSTFLKETDDYSRIQAYGTAGSSPSYFRVVQKDGTRLYYGDYKNTLAFQKSSGSDDYIAWYLAVQEDVHGNYIRYQYEQDVATGDVWLTSITYTLNDGHTFGHTHRVDFSYQRYADAHEGYIGGCMVKRDKILKEVTMLTDDEVMRRYTLDYIRPTDKFSTSYPRLHRIQEYGQGGTQALNPMVIQWGEAGAYKYLNTKIQAQEVDMIKGDFNGDGKSDILVLYDLDPDHPYIERNFIGEVHMGTEYGISTTVFVFYIENRYSLRAYAGDMDGDGLDDVVFQTSGNFEFWKASFARNGLPEFTKQNYTVRAYTSQESLITIADVDGDGQGELVVDDYYYNYGVSNGIHYGLNRPSSSYSWTIGDFDNDGCQDIILYDTGDRVVVTSVAKQKKLLDKRLSIGGIKDRNSVLLVGYFNNDRYLDFFLANGYSQTNRTGRIYYYTGKGEEFVYEDLRFATEQYGEYLSGDFNGDGLTDIACINVRIDFDKQSGAVNRSSSDWVTVYFAPHFNTSEYQREPGLFLSDSIGTASTAQGSYYYEGKKYLYPEKHFAMAGDFSGDGKSDILNVCLFKNVTGSPAPSWAPDYMMLKQLDFSRKGASDKVASIVNGDGTRRDISYDLSNSAARTPSFYNGSYADWNKAIPTFGVVQQVKLGNVYNERPAENRRYFFSQPLYVRKASLEFQGFGQVVCADSVSNRNTTDTYLVKSLSGSYGYYSLSKSLVKHQTDTIALKNYVMSGTRTYGICAFHYLASSTEADYLKGTRKQTSCSYASGNLTSRTTVYAPLASANGGETVTFNEAMTYATCSQLSTYPNRMNTYRTSYSCNGTQQPDRNITLTYNASGDLLTRTEHGMKQTYVYDGLLGLVTSDTLVADGQKRINRYEYDDARYVKKHTDPVGLVTLTVQDAFGNLLTETAPDGLTTTHQRDIFGRLVATVAPDGVTTEYKQVWTVHTGVGGFKKLFCQQTYDNGILCHEEYKDCYGRTVEERELQPGGNWSIGQRYNNATGLPFWELHSHKAKDATSMTTSSIRQYQYDAFQRVSTVQEISAKGIQRIVYSHSPLMERKAIIESKTSVETVVYNSRWLPVLRTDTLGSTTYAYDAAGRLLKTVSAGYPVEYTYNDYGLRTSASNLSSGTTTYAYNGFNELVTVTDGNGNTTSHVYDLAGRLVRTTDGDRTLNYVYNNKGQLAEEGCEGHKSVYTYDSKGRLQREVKTIKDRSFTKSYTYDSQGRLLTYTSPSGLVQKYGYNAYHDLVSITDNATADTLWRAVEFNEMGLVKREINSSNRPTDYGYDMIGRLTSIVHDSDTLNFQYIRNDSRLQTRKVLFGGNGLTESFEYDAGGCLVNSTLLGQTPVTVSYNKGCVIGSKSDVGSYSYTAAGAPLATLSPMAGYAPAAQQLTYYKNNRLKSLTQGDYTLTYEYGPDNRRDYSRLAFTGLADALANPPSRGYTRYYFDDFEQNIDNQTGEISNIDYIFADGRWVSLIRTVGGTRSRYGVLTDHQGSLTALYDEQGLVQAFSYDAWGNRRHPQTGQPLAASDLTAVSAITARGYTGHEHLDAFGLIDMNARIYDPRIGMFISVDPQAESYYETYPYAYCGGDPVNRVDPSGEDYWSSSDPNVINDFWRWFNGSGTLDGYEFDGWFHLSDEEFHTAYEKYGPQTLTYNDESQTLYTSRGKVENGLVVIYGEKTLMTSYRLVPIDRDSYLLQGTPPLPSLGAARVVQNSERTARLIRNFHGIWSRTKKYTRVGNAFKHWVDHGKQFPEFKNAKQYVEAAWNFLHNPPAGTLMHTRINGEIIRYNPITNTFGVLGRDGIPKTMFKPENGWEYWLRQISNNL